MMRQCRQLNADRVTLAHDAAGHDDRHDPGLADQIAVAVAIQCRRHQSGLQAIELAARVAQSGDLDDSLAAEAQARPSRQSEQVDPRCRYILAHQARQYLEAAHPQFLEQFGVNHVDLAQIRRRRVFRDSRAVLDGRALMRVAVHPKPLDEANAVVIWLRQAVRRAATHSRDDAASGVHAAPHRLRKAGLRFSIKAAMPSFWSSVAKVEWNRRRSKRNPSASVVSNARLTDSLTIIAIGVDSSAMRVATASASSSNLSAGTMRLTSPARSASAASIMRPVRHKSIALALPIKRGRRCVPPAPGIVPRLISGCPKRAFSAAMTMSHIIATSQPPPSAKPPTATMTGLRHCATRSQPDVMKSSA